MTEALWTAGEELDRWLTSLSDSALLSLLGKVSEEVQRRNHLLDLTGGKSKEDVIQGIADALLGKKTQGTDPV